MLFNSAVFLFAFLPVVLAGFHLLDGRGRRRTALVWLTLASLVFYGWWDVRFVPLILGSIALNHLLGGWIAWLRGSARAWATGLGVASNLIALFWFKYAFFATSNLDRVLPGGFPIVEVALPIGISFFTFQQIAFLVDVHRGRIVDFDFLRYALFVAFFPQLIAGPIVHHREAMPQFLRARTRALTDLAVGLTIFVVGLFKKMVLADSLALGVGPTFDAAASGEVPSMLEAWSTVLCYALQIYFDFSAYSDMAVGLARLFGIRLPINFASPYKATSIVDFWRRWHVTLSRFLRDYLYVALGGNRRGPVRRYVNVFLTMLLGGLWHGAGWTFLLWGAIHGPLIVINQLWRAVWPTRRPASALAAWTGRIVTFVCAALAWVPFRADDLATTANVYAGLFGGAGLRAADEPRVDSDLSLLALGLLLVCWLGPNIYELMGRYRPGLSSADYPATAIPSRPRRALEPRWRPTPAFAALSAVLLVLSLLKLNDISEFIYFRF